MSNSYNALSTIAVKDAFLFSISSNTTTNGTSLDLGKSATKDLTIGFKYKLKLGSSATLTVTPLIEYSDDGSTWTVVPDRDLVFQNPITGVVVETGKAAAAALTADGDSHIGVVKSHRYYRASVVSTNYGTTASLVSVDVYYSKNPRI